MTGQYETWHEHLRVLRRSVLSLKGGSVEFHEKRTLVSRWVEFLSTWATEDSPFDDEFQKAIDEAVPEAATIVGLEPLDLWFKITTLWNWRQARKQHYEDSYLGFGPEDTNG